MPFAHSRLASRLLHLLLSMALVGLPLQAGAEAGSPFDEARQQAQDLSRLHSLVVAHEGEIVFEQAFRGPATDRPVNIKSLSKTILAAITGASIEQGLIDSVKEPVIALLGERVPHDATPGVEEITVSHLLSLQAGLERTSGSNYGAWVSSDDWIGYVLTRPFVDEPGGRMLYSTGSSHLLSAVLTQASGRSTLQLARNLLGEPLEIAIPAWPQDPQGIYFGGNDMLLSPRALIMIGELYRNDGVHEERRILPEGWVERSWRPRGESRWSGDAYGYGWFITELNGERAYYGRGFGGQGLYVIPALALTVAITADPTPPSPGGSFQRELHDLVAETVIPAVRKSASQAAKSVSPSPR